MSVTSGRHSLARVLTIAIDSRLRWLHTAQPGIVVSYDAATQTADVRPAINVSLPDAADEDLDVHENLPVCPHVPVVWPRAQGFSMVGTLSPGDTVLLVFCERDYAGWYETGDVSDPQFAELHALNGAVAIPGFVPRDNPIPVPSDAAALASKLDALIGILKGWTPVTSDGGAALKAAVLAAFPGPGIPANAAPTPMPGSTGSDVLKLGG